MSTLGKGQLIGLEDALNERINSSSLKCITTKGLLMGFKKDDFSHFVQKDPEIQEKFLELSVCKDNVTSNIINSIKENRIEFSKPLFESQNLNLDDSIKKIDKKKQ